MTYNITFTPLHTLFRSLPMGLVSDRLRQVLCLLILLTCLDYLSLQQL
jgi:hypothetical protein